MQNTENEKPKDEEDNIESESGLTIETDDNDPLEIYPLAKVDIDKDQWSIGHIQELTDLGNMIILDPEFQRDYVWDNKKRCELIESILMKIPLPVIYLFQTIDGDFQVVDGKQRLQTILDFLSDKFPLKGLKILRGKPYEGSKFSDLPIKNQMLFKGFQLFLYIIQPSTTERIKYDIFDRVNRGGSRLNNQEMRNALYCGKSTRLLNDLVSSNDFLQVIGRRFSNKRKKGDYVILRLLSFYMLWEGLFEKAAKPFEYKGDLEDFLAKSMNYLNHEIEDNCLNEIKRKFQHAMNRLSELMGDDAFRFASKDGSAQRRSINMLLIDTLGYLFMKEDEIGIELNNVDFDQLKLELDKSDLFNGKNESIERVLKRRDLVIELAKKYDRKDPNFKL